MRMHRLAENTLVMGTVVLSLSGPWIIRPLALAQSKAPQPPSIRFVPAQPKLPPRGTPRAQNGTGSRGDCVATGEEQALTRLVGAAPLDLTTSDRPTIWLYLPYTKQEVSQGEFSLKWQKKDLHRQTIPLPEKPGIVGIQLPETIDPLELGQTYRWYFDVLCDANNAEAAPASLTGLIKRIEATSELNQELARAASSLERVAIYAKHHLWYDTLQDLAQLRLETEPDPSLQRIWRDLLSDPSVGLEAVAQEPIVGYLSGP